MKNMVNKFKSIFQGYDDFKFKFTLSNWQTDFYRFFRSMTNYNISKNSLTLEATVYKGKKSYSFEISEPNEKKLKTKLEFVNKFIDNLPEDPDFVDIEKDTTVKELPSINNNILQVPLTKKIEILASIANKVKKYDHKIYGTFITNFVQFYIINSNGVNKYYELSPIMLDVKSMSNKNMASVIESFGGADFSNFNEEGFEKRLLNKVELSQLDIINIDPGKYPVILSPAAIGEFITYLGHTINGRSIDTKESYFIDKVGKKELPDYIDLSDEPLNEGTIPYFYNQEGKTLSNLNIIKKGVFENFMVDNYYANKLKMNENGNMGTNLVLHRGMDELPDMIANIDKGLYISKLHYMNFMNPKETTVTGLTRDGTFYIENGKIKNVVVNLRFTESIVNILKNIIMLENKLTSIPSSTNYGNFFIFSQLMPHVLVKDFSITSSTNTL
ncbi:TldD/PmbA family protein [bacterium]|nr:TldD/PmbA family protein [bacterium]